VVGVLAQYGCRRIIQVDAAHSWWLRIFPFLCICGEICPHQKQNKKMVESYRGHAFVLACCWHLDYKGEGTAGRGLGYPSVRLSRWVQ